MELILTLAIPFAKRLDKPLPYPLGHRLNSTLSIAGKKVIETLEMDVVDLLLMRFQPAAILLGKSVAARTGLEDIPISCGILAMNMVVPRALPVTAPVSLIPDPEIGQWHPIKFYDGTVVQACYQGQLGSSADLPNRGRFIGEEWSTGNTSWIWMTPAGASFPSWVDP
jgi:hypothetical protein